MREINSVLIAQKYFFLMPIKAPNSNNKCTLKCKTGLLTFYDLQKSGVINDLWKFSFSNELFQTIINLNLMGTTIHTSEF